MTTNRIIIRSLGRQDYLSCWQAMQLFTNQRNANTLDEIWLLEHNPVFTQGQNGKAEHILNAGNIPVIQSDRGGQVTYHGPGQLIAYTLIDVKRQKLNVRQLVTCLEQSIIQLLAEYHISATAKGAAPGIYIGEQKICSIGLRIRRGNSFHGLAFNTSIDLEPFTRINPCGFPNLSMTKLVDWVSADLIDTHLLEKQVIKHLASNLGYTNCLFQAE